LFGRKPKIIAAIFVDKNKEKSLKRRKGIELPQGRFGLIALEKGFIKADQLYEALIRQRAQEAGGAERRPLGMILKDLRYLTVSQINEIMQTLEPKAEHKKNVPEVFE
jgi:ribosomal 50S subunit-associated protein YjgA (DUF615 family)